jgi:hypothetical protein
MRARASSISDHVDNLYLAIEGLAARNEILWKALRFYSFESNYYGVGGGDGAPELTKSPIMKDLGRTARFVLEYEEQKCGLGDRCVSCGKGSDDDD